MKVTSIRDFRDKATVYFKKDEPVLITRHGKVAGLYIPLGDVESIPLDIRKELLYKFGEYISKSLKKAEVKEEDIIAEFNRYKKDRC